VCGRWWYGGSGSTQGLSGAARPRSTSRTLHPSHRRIRRGLYVPLRPVRSGEAASSCRSAIPKANGSETIHAAAFDSTSGLTSEPSWHHVWEASVAAHARDLWRSASMPTTARSTSRSKVRALRDRLCKMGLRPVQIWVPDVQSKAFGRAAHRQSLAVAKGPYAPDPPEFSLKPSRQGCTAGRSSENGFSHSGRQSSSVSLQR
jgi:hypothetical protein